MSNIFFNHELIFALERTQIQWFDDQKRRQKKRLSQKIVSFSYSSNLNWIYLNLCFPTRPPSNVVLDSTFVYIGLIQWFSTFLGAADHFLSFMKPCFDNFLQNKAMIPIELSIIKSSSFFIIYSRRHIIGITIT